MREMIQIKVCINNVFVSPSHDISIHNEIDSKDKGKNKSHVFARGETIITIKQNKNSRG